MVERLITQNDLLLLADRRIPDSLQNSGRLVICMLDLGQRYHRECGRKVAQVRRVLKHINGNKTLERYR